MGILDGIRVLDVGHHLAGPLTARLLGEYGAEVVRIDRPDRVEHSSDAYLQAGKKRITLDLKQSANCAHALRLAASVDVVIENFRPGVTDRLGLGYESVSALNPGVVYCSLPGFGSQDPRASIPGWEGVINAATGDCRVRIGEAPPEWDYGRPTYSSLPLASNFAAILGATAVVAALDARHTNGRGARIEVPLYDATFELMSHAASYAVERGFEIEGALDTKGSGTYECADGRFVQFNPLGSTLRFLTWFFEATGHPEWVSDGFTRNASYVENPGLADELRKRLTLEFKTRPAIEWEHLGMSAGVPLCMIRTTDEWFQTSQAIEGGQVVDIDDPVFGPVRVAGAPVTVSGMTQAKLVRHLLDEDRDELLEEQPSRAALPGEPSSHAVEFAPFEGLRVIDLTQILAGPSAGRALGEYGADVIKVNAPQTPIGAHGVVNRGKRTMLVDLQKGEGVELLWDLIADADVVTQNFPPGRAERYGIGYEQVHARYPHIVYVSVSCYGRSGPLASGRGYEVQGQAVTGIMERTGRDGRPGVLGPYNPLDYGTGAMAAFAGALGIYHTRRTGHGPHVSTSLTETGTFHQATMVMSPRQLDARTHPAGRTALGKSALQRFYKAADRWLFVGASLSQRDELAATFGLECGDDTSDHVDPEGKFAGALAEAIAKLASSAIVAKLAAIGVGVHVVSGLPDILDLPYVRSTGLSVEQDSPEVGAVVLPGPVVLVDGKRLAAGPVSNIPGADARDVLDEYSHHDVDALAAKWVVQLDALPAGWPIY